MVLGNEFSAAGISSNALTAAKPTFETNLICMTPSATLTEKPWFNIERPEFARA